MSRFDFNEDGYISREDYKLMSMKLAEYSEMTSVKAEEMYLKFLKVAGAFNLSPKAKVRSEKAARQVSDAILSMSREERTAMVRNIHGPLFGIIDTNNDGLISLEEFKVFFYVITPESSEADIVNSFSLVDKDRNGEISQEEFLSAAEDFFNGVEETDVSKGFLGRLLD